LLLYALLMAAAHSEDTVPNNTRYFGLAVPYPDHIPVLVRSDSAVAEIGRRVYELNLTVDSTGAVRDMEYSSGSVFPFPSIVDEIKNIRFQFLPGRTVSSPHIVPISVTTPGIRRRQDTLSLSFPVSEVITTDSVLLGKYFAVNGIEPPRVTDMPPVTYVFDIFDTTARCWTVTMQVFLDRDGQLLNIAYPNPRQAEMAHQVHIAAMHASFAPARIRGEPFAADFLLTFRIFDNLDYPFSPFKAADSTRPRPITARYFLTHYYNENDISIFPLPQKHAQGFIRGAKFAEYPPGLAEIVIAIDSAGKIERAVVMRSTAGIRLAASEAVWLTSWYPAVVASGETTAFTGKMRLEFTGSSKIVYIPEWFSP